MKTASITRLTMITVAAIGLYVAAVTGTPRACLTAEQVAAASANSWQGVSLTCNEAIRQARLEERQPYLAAER